MHAGTEQLLTLRDGGPVGAGVALHVKDCPDCRDRLAQLKAMTEQLRGLPELNPPAGSWAAVSARLDQPAPHRYGWLGAAVAAMALLAVALWQFSGGNDAADQVDRVALTGPAVAIPTVEPDSPPPATAQLDALELSELVAQSRQLEQLLRELNNNTPRVMNAGTAGTIAGLQDGIAYIDYGLSYNERLNQSQSEQLWRQRVGLMNTLVQVRGAQWQQTSN